MNLNKENEKLMKWHYKNGYSSEDSDDPTVVWNRFERQFDREMQLKHRDQPVYL